MKSLNPRVACFLSAHRLSLKDIQRVNGEVAHLALGGCCMPWTAHFMLWNSAQWRTWAAELGFTRGSEPHREALRAGHSADAFDEWLHRQCGRPWTAPSAPR